MRALRELALLPLRGLDAEQRRQALQELVAAMVTDVPTDSGTLRFVTSTPLLYSRARGALVKEPDTIEWIDGFAAGDVLWDVGANVGVFSLYAARRPEIRVLAFEPSADNYAALCANVFGNSFGDRIIPYCIAFAGTTELGVLNSPSREVGTAMHQFGKPGEGSRYWKGSVSHAQGMVGYTIDEFISRFDPPFPTHVKLDVDGLEWPILVGAPKTLRDPRLRSLMVELNLTDKPELARAKELLSDAGFECVRLGQRFTVEGELAMNHFFARKKD